MIPNKLMPWYMAQARKFMVTQTTLGIYWWEQYWVSLAEMMWPSGE